MFFQLVLEAFGKARNFPTLAFPTFVLEVKVVVEVASRPVVVVIIIIVYKQQYCSSSSSRSS